MIESFGDRATEDLYDGRRTNRTRRFPPTVLPAALRKLDMLMAAHRLDDLRSVPGSRLEKWEDRYSIRVNDQWRITFQWSIDSAHEVSLIDYH